MSHSVFFADATDQYSEKSYAEHERRRQSILLSLQLQRTWHRRHHGNSQRILPRQYVPPLHHLTPVFTSVLPLSRFHPTDQATESARRAGTPYYDPSSTKDKPKWDLVHVSFRKKFAVQIGLKELRELGKAGGPLENMQMLKQTRLSVSRVSGDEFKALCELADEKAKEAGLEHEV